VLLTSDLLSLAQRHSRDTCSRAYSLHRTRTERETRWSSDTYSGSMCRGRRSACSFRSIEVEVRALRSRLRNSPGQSRPRVRTLHRTVSVSDLLDLVREKHPDKRLSTYRPQNDTELLKSTTPTHDILTRGLGVHFACTDICWIGKRSRGGMREVGGGKRVSPAPPPPPAAAPPGSAPTLASMLRSALMAHSLRTSKSGRGPPPARPPPPPPPPHLSFMCVSRRCLDPLDESICVLADHYRAARVSPPLSLRRPICPAASRLARELALLARVISHATTDFCEYWHPTRHHHRIGDPVS
jgi:hypothetical protein